MEKCFSVTLAGKKTTDVLFADSISDLSYHLSGYGQNVLWVFDVNSAGLFKELPENRIVIDAGEKYKTIGSIERILNYAVELGLSRDSRFIGFGGGVICDMTAFAASLYMRGCKLTLVPTTLLSQVDASVGGKTGVDFSNAKNLIGTFYPASEVLISSDTLRTLSEKEYLCGLGEVIKHAVLSRNEDLYNYLKENRVAILKKERTTLLEMVKKSIAVKIDFIERDPEELLGIRSFLNLGHTFAHALESSGKFVGWSHGQAVAWGLVMALQAGVKIGQTEADFANKYISLLRDYGFKVNHKIGRGEWIDFSASIMKDKKKAKGKIMFVLMKGQGEPFLSELETKVIQETVIAPSI